MTAQANSTAPTPAGGENAEAPERWFDGATKKLRAIPGRTRALIAGHKKASIIGLCALVVVAAGGTGTGIYFGYVSHLENSLASENRAAATTTATLNQVTLVSNTQRAAAKKEAAAWTPILTNLASVADPAAVKTLTADVAAYAKDGTTSPGKPTTYRTVVTHDSNITALNTAIASAKSSNTSTRHATSTLISGLRTVQAHKSDLAAQTAKVAGTLAAKSKTVLATNPLAAADAKAAFTKAYTAAAKSLTPAAASALVAAYKGLIAAQKVGEAAAQKAAQEAAAKAAQDAGADSYTDPVTHESVATPPSASGGSGSGGGNGGAGGGGGSSSGSGSSGSGGGGSPSGGGSSSGSSGGGQSSPPPTVSGHPVFTGPPLPANSVGTGDNCGSGAIVVPSNAVIVSQGYSDSLGCYDIVYKGPGATW